ncbi:MAG: hypothetical protein JXO22_15585 [Phycisphaerae bacterium]|nr:hypothetical protein [Phycisphaerae bacterium]
MSWMNLFKSKTAKGKSDPRVRWFGKLPTYADYYSSATDEDWAVEFNDWILKGYEAYVGRRHGRSAHVPDASCILRLPKSHMTVFATIQDFGGDMRGRPFPLCFYAAVPSPAWPGPTSERVGVGLQVLGGLSHLRDKVVRFMNAPGRFEDAFGAEELDLAVIDNGQGAAWLQEARALAFADWFKATQACLQTDDLAAWYRLACRWGDDIARCEDEHFDPTLRLPLALRLPQEAQIAGWLRWLEQRMDIEHRFLSLLFSTDGDGAVGHLSVIAREVVPEDFVLMTPEASSLGYVDDMCALAASDSDATPPQHDSVRAPEQWADFVESAAMT